MKIKLSKFTRLVRIRKSQLEWLKANKGKYTLAGMLDKIINEYKNVPKQIDKKAGQKGLRQVKVYARA